MEEIIKYGPSIIRWIFIILGGFATLVIIIGAVRGIFSVLWRLGLSLHNRKIALYAEGDSNSLQSMLIDSKLFKKKNIHIIGNSEISKGLEYSMMIVNFPEFKDTINEILGQKKDNDSLIIYAPQSAGKIPLDVLDKINLQRNSIIVNMRGRLLNDLLTAMITTNYGKK